MRQTSVIACHLRCIEKGNQAANEVKTASIKKKTALFAGAVRADIQPSAASIVSAFLSISASVCILDRDARVSVPLPLQRLLQSALHESDRQNLQQRYPQHWTLHGEYNVHVLYEYYYFIIFILHSQIKMNIRVPVLLYQVKKSCYQMKKKNLLILYFE